MSRPPNSTHWSYFHTQSTSATQPYYPTTPIPL